MSRRTLFVLCVVVIASAVGIRIAMRARTPTVPIPANLETLEGAVAAKIRSLHDAVVGEPTLSNWSRYARTLHAHQLTEEAQEAYRVAADMAPPRERFDLLYLAGTSVAISDPEAARAWFEDAVALRGDYAPVFLRLGEIHEKAGRLGEARRAYERAAEIDQSSHAFLGTGRVALAEGRIPDAIENLERARAKDPEHSEVWAALTRAYARAGRKKDAEQAAAGVGDLRHPHGFDDSIVAGVIAEGVSYETFERLTLERLKANDPAGALELVDRALAVRPESATAHLQRGRILGMLGRTADASQAFERVLALQPDDVDAMAFQAACLIALKQPKEAVALLNRALAIDPVHVNAHVNLGILLQAARPEEAMRHLRFALERNPRRIDARLTLASILVALGKKEEAAAEVRAVLDQDPKNAIALRMAEDLAGR